MNQKIKLEEHNEDALNFNLFSLEYNQVKDYMFNLEGKSSKLINFSLIIVSLIVTGGFHYEVNEIFILTPIIIIWILHYIISFNYAYRVRERYLIKLEKKAQKLGYDYPAFYSNEISKYFYNLSVIGKILLPFHLSVFFRILFVFIIGVFCTIKGINYLNSKYAPIYSNIYLSIIITMITFSLLSFIWSNHNVKKNIL